MFIGVMFNIMLYGVMVAQTYLYYNMYKERVSPFPSSGESCLLMEQVWVSDRTWMKIFVGVIHNLSLFNTEDRVRRAFTNRSSSCSYATLPTRASTLRSCTIHSSTTSVSSGCPSRMRTLQIEQSARQQGTYLLLLRPHGVSLDFRSPFISS